MIVFIRTLLVLTIGLVSACSTTTETSKTNLDSARSVGSSDSVAPVQPGSDVERLLQGNWQSLSDPDDTFTIDGPRRISIANGQPPLTLAFAYMADCGGSVCANRESRYGCFTTAGEFDIDCQAILAISATELTVSQGNTGQTVRYQKKP